MLPKDSLRNRPASHRALRWSQITMRDTPRLLLRLGLLLGLSVPLHAKAERPKPPLPTPNHLPPPLPNPLPPPPSVPSLTTLPPEQAQPGGLAHDLVLQPVPLTPSRDRKQIRIGALIWAAGYLPALVAPLLLWPQVDTPGGPSALANYSLLIPLIGPYVSAIAGPAQAEAGNGRAVLSSWSVPWLLTSGLVQTTGFVYLLSGAIPRLRSTGAIAVMPTPAGVNVMGRF
jgi:hypothetical protein